jgi:hypothetical protein
VSDVSGILKRSEKTLKRVVDIAKSALSLRSFNRYEDLYGNLEPKRAVVD